MKYNKYIHLLHHIIMFDFILQERWHHLECLNGATGFGELKLDHFHQSSFWVRNFKLFTYKTYARMNHVFTLYSFPGLQIIIIKRWHKRKVKFGNFSDRDSLFGTENGKKYYKKKYVKNKILAQKILSRYILSSKQKFYNESFLYSCNQSYY